MATVQDFDFSLPIKENITWQDDPTNVASLISAKSSWYESQVSEFFNTWSSSVFNLKSASAFGCAVWAVILGVPVSLVYSGEAGLPPFGFGGGRENFRYANFDETGWSGTLTVSEMKSLLLMRYLTQTIAPTVTHINYALNVAFEGLGGAHVLSEDTQGSMTMKYVLGWQATAVLKSALVDLNILPRPCGVAISVESL